MNKSFHLLLILLAFSFSPCVRAAKDAALPATLAERSEWWPERIRLTTNFDYEVEGEAKTLKGGKSGILVRIVGMDAIIDFGTSGIHSVSLADTNIIETLADPADRRQWKGQGKILTQLSNKLYWPDTQRQTSSLDFEGKDYLLLVYVDVGSEASAQAEATVIASYAPLTEAYPSLAFITLPMDATQEDIIVDMQNMGSAWPAVLPFLSESYIHAMHHQPTNPSVVVVDKNGKLLGTVRGKALQSGTQFTAQISEMMNEDIALRNAHKQAASTL